MLVPVRCFTCGNTVSDKFEEYQNKVKSGEEPAKVLDSLGIKKVLLSKNVVNNSRDNTTSASVFMRLCTKGI